MPRKRRPEYLKPLTPGQKTKRSLEKLRGKIDLLDKSLREQHMQVIQLPDIHIGDTCVVDLHANIGAEIVQGSSQDPVGATTRFAQRCANIIIGLALYLQTLPNQSPVVSAWRPMKRAGYQDTSLISDEAEICSVSSTHKLSTD